MYYSQSLQHRIEKGDNLYQLSKFFKRNVQSIPDLNPEIDPYDLRIGSQSRINPEAGYVWGQEAPNSNITNNDYKKNQLINHMRMLWEQHVYWTRMVMLSIVEGLADKDAVITKLLENPKDFARVFADYYNEETANGIDKLLTEHLSVGAELITALAKGDFESAKRLVSQWYDNADDIAEGLGNINPYFQTEALREMFYNHLDKTSKEVSDQIAGKYPDSISAFDDIEREALAMADFLSSGIIKQFPNKFM